MIYVAINRALYLTARRATLMERSSLQQDQTASASNAASDAVERFDDEVEKLLRSLDEDDELEDRIEIENSNDLPVDGVLTSVPVSASPFTRASISVPSHTEETCPEPTDLLLPKQKDVSTELIL